METKVTVVQLGNRTLGVLVSCTKAKLSTFVDNWVNENGEDEEVQQVCLWEVKDQSCHVNALHDGEFEALVSGDEGMLLFDTRTVTLH